MSRVAEISARGNAKLDRERERERDGDGQSRKSRGVRER